MKRQQEIILILGSMFVVSVIWIILNLYQNAVTSTISETLSEDIISITPNFNTTIIEKLKSRHYINPLYSFTSPQPINTASATASIQQNAPIGTVNQTGQSPLSTPSQ